MAEVCSSEGFVDKAVQIYREYSKAASVTKAEVSFLSQDPRSETLELSIISNWSQRDLERNENCNFHRSHIASYDATTKTINNIREPSFPIQVQNLQWSSVSPSGKLQAVLRKVPGTKGQEDKQFLEIWSCGNLVKNVNVQACEKHGNIYEDFQFGCLAWSASEQYLLYVAEKKLPKAVSYFERQNSDQVSPDKPAPVKGAQFEFKEDWGEQLVSKSCPVLVIFDVTSDEIRVLDGVPDYLSAGQACWGPDDSSVVFVGWFHVPYRLGIIYCPIRKNALFSLSLDGKRLKQLGDTKYAVHSPRFNQTKDKLIYLALNVGGPHCQCGRLMEYDWKTEATSTIIDLVDFPERGGFPGIYVWSILPERCWTADGKGVIFHTRWRSYMKIVLVNCSDKSVTVLTSAPGAWSLLDVKNDILLASHSSPNSPPKLMIAALPEVVPESGLSWIPVAQSYHSLEKEITWEVLSFAPSENSDFKDEYEALLLRPVMEDDTKPPLIVYPHGGPHSSFAGDFGLPLACLCRLGFAILCVNFRGSLGFGQGPLLSLIGKIGTQDAQDVQGAAIKVLESGKLDASNVFVMGGSHGGFLTGHLIGQYPDFYRAAAMRNPALNVAVMTEISDVPDWCYSEGGYKFHHGSTPTPEMLAEMLKKSPMSHITKVKTPTLIMLGSDDMRVPPSQGKSFYRALKAQGTEARLLLYPDNNHPIAKVDAESDLNVNRARWFYDHLKK